MDVRMEQGWHDAIAELIIGAQLCQPDELSAVVNTVTSPLGVDVTVFPWIWSSESCGRCPSVASRYRIR